MREGVLSAICGVKETYFTPGLYFDRKSLPSAFFSVDDFTLPPDAVSTCRHNSVIKSSDFCQTHQFLQKKVAWENRNMDKRVTVVSFSAARGQHTTHPQQISLNQKEIVMGEL